MDFAYLNPDRSIIAAVENDTIKTIVVFRGDVVDQDLYDQYQDWVAAGNEATIYIRPSVEERLQAAETLINLILDEGEV